MIERFVVESRVLYDRPEEAVTLVQLGALANAIGAAITLAAGSVAQGAGAGRDFVQAVLLIASYFKEAVDAINTKHSWGLIEAGVKSGYRLPLPLDEFKRMYSRGDGSLYRSILDLRNTKGFHVDQAHFRDWLSGLGSPFVTLWRKDSQLKFDWAFTASAEIQASSGARLDQATGLEVLGAASNLVFLVEAMACGLVVQAGMDPRASWRRMVPHEIRFEYTFYDGRLPFCNTEVFHIDANGDFTSVAGELRDHVTRTMGGRRAGAVIPGTGAPIGFSSDRGTALAWLGRPVIVDPPEADPRAIVLRMRGMASFGAHASKEAAEYTNAVRAGAADPNTTARFAERVSEHQSYWEARRREIEQIIELLRRHDQWTN